MLGDGLGKFLQGGIVEDFARLVHASADFGGVNLFQSFEFGLGDNVAGGFAQEGFEAASEAAAFGFLHGFSLLSEALLEFGGNFAVGDGAFGIGVVLHDGQAVAGRFCKAHVARHHGREHQAFQVGFEAA